MHDLVIRGGTVVDGTGAAPRRADVAISNARIVEVGENVGEGTREIDATGLSNEAPRLTLRLAVTPIQVLCPTPGPINSPELISICNEAGSYGGCRYSLGPVGGLSLAGVLVLPASSGSR